MNPVTFFFLISTLIGWDSKDLSSNLQEHLQQSCALNAFINSGLFLQPLFQSPYVLRDIEDVEQIHHISFPHMKKDYEIRNSQCCSCGIRTHENIVLL